jgi:2-polyprenyl-3-methyl-5-hydroxy-6-metoxy-1,4-benzoquinol methylase
MAAHALSQVRDRPQARLLDLGCGTGAAAIELALARIDITVVALDISPANVAAARAAADAAGLDRIATVCADYGGWTTTPFDAIVSDSVLHTIPVEDTVLAARLARDVTPGGVLLASMPVESRRNALRIMARRLWRATPASADRMALAVAQRLYPRFSREELAERVSYLRFLPFRLLGPRFAAIMTQAGFDLVERAPWDNVSIAKLEHQLFIWRRR